MEINITPLHPLKLLIIKIFAMSQEIPFDNSIFNSRLSFVPLITYLKKTVASEMPGAQNLYNGLIESFESAPELLQPIEDLSLLEKHKELVEMLLSTVF